MTFVLLLPAILSFLVLGAHFMHGQGPAAALAAYLLPGGNLLPILACLVLCALLTLRRRWMAKTAQVVLILAALEWVFTTQARIDDCLATGHDWHRSAIILLAVAAVNLVAAALFQTRTLRRRYSQSRAESTHSGGTRKEANELGK